MRCNKCNVDLPESYTRCPLCGSKPTDCEPKITGLNTVPYSVSPIGEQKNFQKEKAEFSFEKIKAYFNL